MESIEEITKSLEKEAKEKKKEIIQEAEKEAEEIKSEAQKKADSKKQEIIDEGKREAEAIEKRILSNAKTEARRRKLEFKDELSEKVFSEAMNKIKKMKNEEEKHSQTMINLIKDGGISVGGGEIEVLVLEGDNFLTDKQIKKIEKDIQKETENETSIKILENLETANGGAFIRKKDGTLQCNNTFSARMERMKDSLRTEVTKILFKD